MPLNPGASFDRPRWGVTKSLSNTRQTFELRRKEYHD